MTRWHIKLVSLVAFLSLLAFVGCQKEWDRWVSKEGEEDLQAELPTTARAESALGEEAQLEMEATEVAASAGESEEGKAQWEGPAEEGEMREEAASGEREPIPSGREAGVAETRGPGGEVDLLPLLTRQLSPDLSIALSQLRNAVESVAQGEEEVARQGIRKAQIALTFAVSALPPVLVRQNCERAMASVGKGDAKGSGEAIRLALRLADQVELRGSVNEFQRHGNNAIRQLSDGKGTDALEELALMAQAVEPAPAEALIDEISEHLRGAEDALTRAAGEVAEAELKGARTKLLSLMDTLAKEG